MTTKKGDGWFAALATGAVLLAGIAAANSGKKPRRVTDKSLESPNTNYLPENEYSTTSGGRDELLVQIDDAMRLSDRVIANMKEHISINSRSTSSRSFANDQHTIFCQQQIDKNRRLLRGLESLRQEICYKPSMTSAEECDFSRRIADLHQMLM